MALINPLLAIGNPPFLPHNTTHMDIGYNGIFYCRHNPRFTSCVPQGACQSTSTSESMRALGMSRCFPFTSSTTNPS
jgi:hypothetical protein